MKLPNIHTLLRGSQPTTCRFGYQELVPVLNYQQTLNIDWIDKAQAFQFCLSVPDGDRKCSGLNISENLQWTSSFSPSGDLDPRRWAGLRHTWHCVLTKPQENANGKIYSEALSWLADSIKLIEALSSWYFLESVDGACVHQFELFWLSRYPL